MKQGKQYFDEKKLNCGNKNLKQKNEILFYRNIFVSKIIPNIYIIIKQNNKSIENYSKFSGNIYFIFCKIKFQYSLQLTATLNNHIK